MHRSTPRSLRRTRHILTATALAAVAFPAAAAQAAEVTAVGTEIVVDDNGGRFGQGLDDNRLIAESLPGGELRLVDQVPLVVKATTCLNVTSLEVRCVRPSNSPISKLTFRARRGHDQLRPAGSLPIRYEGGSGNDLYVGARSAAPTRVDFQGGDDEGDLAHYTNAQSAVHVTKDEVANDGRTLGNDRDNIRNDVEVVAGTRFDDAFGGVIGAHRLDEFRPLGGDDVVFGGDFITRVDMGSARDGADRIVGGGHTEVSYAQRTNPIRAAVDLLGADDGEAGEGDELVGVGAVIGGSAGDRMLLGRVGPESVFGIAFDGGPGADVITGNNSRDHLTGGLGRDILGGDSGNDTLLSADGDVDTVRCGLGTDTATTDTAEETVTECETRLFP